MPKRSLMLAGGGLKIAFQAGVLQVLLDEAGLQFDHGDAVSAACFNLAMWAQRMSGTRIASNWRNLSPLSVIDVNLSIGPELLKSESLLDLRNFRSRVFPDWGLDWKAINSSGRTASFNVYNFSRHELLPIAATELTEDYLIACASLPIWFPPVSIAGDTYIDAIFNVPCNIEEAIRRGADEIWVIWTTSQRGQWLNGTVNNFFGIFEATTNHVYKQSLARIARNNGALAHGEPSEYGRPIQVRELKAEVPLHYLLNFSRDRIAESVNRGVEFARLWCLENGFSVTQVNASSARTPHGLSFDEIARGYFSTDATDAADGYEQGRRSGTRIELQATVHVEDLNEFITNPNHVARVTGAIECAALGGTLTIVEGSYNFLVDVEDLQHKIITYELRCRPNVGSELTCRGTKDLRDDIGHDAMSDPATIAVELLEGTVPVGKGIVRAHAIDFLKHLASFRSDAPTLRERASDVRRFGLFYLGHLWDVYAHRTVPAPPS